MPGCFTAESLLIQLREFINGSACSNSVVVTKGIQESPSVRSTEPVLLGSLLDAGGTLGSAGAGLDERQRVCSGALCDLWQALTFAVVVLRREDRCLLQGNPRGDFHSVCALGGELCMRSCVGDE